MATTVVSTRKNFPGFNFVECEVTWDNADLSPSLAHGGPEGAEPIILGESLKTDPTDGSLMQVQITFDTVNAEMDLVAAAEGAGSVAGAVTRIGLLFPVDGDQDFDSVFGAGNTGPTF